MSSKPKLVAIVGPTASGKTSLSIEVAERFNGEIVSADSRQIYREMDIGIAKPTREEMGAVPHHLIDIKYPNEDYTASDYKRDALEEIQKILTKNKLPIMAGGTGLYINTVLDNWEIPEVKADPELRKKIENDIARDGLATVFKKLVALDPEATYIVDPKNPRRVVRALEVAVATGKPFTAQRKKNEKPFDALRIGINPPPEILRKRIDDRVDQMIKDGLVEEVERLVLKYGKKQAPFDAIGYREILNYLDGNISLEESVALMKINTWHYAKRQMTWFKKDKTVHWIKNMDEAETLVKNFIKKTEIS